MSDEQGGGEERQAEKWPFTFILLIVAAALYLLVRLIQGIGWLADWVGG
jgi:hypothetical protein